MGCLLTLYVSVHIRHRRLQLMRIDNWVIPVMLLLYFLKVFLRDVWKYVF